MSEAEEALKNIHERAAKAPKQLPIWPDELRAAPNEIIRSSLFTARRSGPREYHQDTVLFILGDGEITYRGEELRTFDEDVWLQVMHLARLQPLGEWVEFTPYAMIRELGWVKGKNRPSQIHYDRLKECLSRMQATTIKVKSKRIAEALAFSYQDKGRSASLIRKFEWEGVDRWRVWIEPEMRALYGDNYYTQVEWQQRTHLSPAAKRLHGWFASHKKPYPVKIENLFKICRIKSELKKFKSRLPQYLGEMQKVGFLETFNITDDGLVSVIRTTPEA